MFKKVLIANRGEIAVRIADVCRDMGVRSVAVYSDPDAESPHVEAADEAVPIGGSRAMDSYMDAARLIEAAKKSGAEAIHPGYGFLAERASFAEACAEAGLVFVGPKADTLRRTGDKVAARRAAVEADVPVIPGSDAIACANAAVAAARSIGFPVLCKAKEGGGGHGLTVAHDDEELRAALLCGRGRVAGSGVAAVLLERYLERPRHVEVQILSDSRGRHLHLFERECSIQRRHQKVIEECPSPLSGAPDGERLLKRMYGAALRLAEAVGYVGAGTVEFLVDRGNFFFIEMNPRLQVEHPCTELTTGFDIIGWQMRIAAGESLFTRQEDISRAGHVIEMRICAEDPDRRFFPSPGKLLRFDPPRGEGIRVDAGVCSGFTVSPFYDSMIAKLISSGSDRPEALDRARQALDRFHVEGIKTNIPAHQQILQSDAFVRAELSTRFIEDHLSLRAS